MTKPKLNFKQIRRFATKLNQGDVDLLWNAIQYCGGGDSGFKGLLESTISRADDRERASRLQTVIHQLSEAELLWLCENYETHPRR